MNLFKGKKKSITKSQLKAILPADFPERMTGYFQDIYKKGKWTTPPNSKKGFDKIIVLAKIQKGECPPLDLESRLEKEGAIGEIPIFECDFTSYNLDSEQALIFIKYIGEIVTFSLDFDMQNWQSSVFWTDLQSGEITDKIAIGRGYKRIV